MPNLQRQLDSQAKTAAEWLLWYEERKREYILAVEQVIAKGRSASNLGTPIQTGTHSDPTYHDAAQLHQLKDQARWIQCVEDVQRTLPPRKLLFLLLRREWRHVSGKGPSGWRRRTQARFIQEARHRGINDQVSFPTLSRWWQEIIEMTARAAALKKLC